uniref:Uncharacterized protein n=1 Tax=Candidatus Kentrum sp. MB TaxID=2138164 RepID=A0A450X3M0_9GAMM|nr:MAG: hypothetical protein BECKMB1821G_GA0114241_100645 [Candidatus Kentron sp. MB]
MRKVLRVLCYCRSMERIPHLFEPFQLRLTLGGDLMDEILRELWRFKDESTERFPSERLGTDCRNQRRGMSIV